MKKKLWSVIAGGAIVVGLTGGSVGVGVGVGGSVGVGVPDL